MDSSASGAEPMPIFYVGQHESRRSVPVTEQVLQQARDCGYDMLTTEISTPHLHAEVWKLLPSYFEELEGGVSADEIPIPLLPPFKPSETYLTPNEIIGQLLAFTSPWIDLSSPDPVVSNISRQIFNQEVAYAAFCGSGNIVVRGPNLGRGRASSEGIAQYARAINEALSLGPYVQIHIHLPIVPDPDWDNTGGVGHLAPLARPEFREFTSDGSQGSDILDAWDAWNTIRTLCKYNARLSVALSLPQHLPPVHVQWRWYSEPVRLLVLPGVSFLLNKRRQPVLSRGHQALISRFMRLKQQPWVLLSDVGPIPGLNDPNMLVPVATGFLSPDRAADASVGASTYPTPAEAAHGQDLSAKEINDPTPHLSYIRYLQKHQPPKPIIERFGAGYQDYLQAPLQPLTDNLESITYEVFEKDPIKYEWYERAITQALKDWVTENKPVSSLNGNVVVAVVGAGRGPLVTRALQASAASGVPIELYAIEKNPNAYVVLQRHNDEDWANRVTVIKSDMRAWKGPLRADGSIGQVDILISELLGSFADNELSPECLDGAQHVLNSYSGISIPASYTAHLSPIAAPKLHADILARAAQDPNVPETPHVVMLHAVDYLSTDGTRARSDSEAKSDTTTPNLETHSPMPDVQTCWSFTHPIPSRILAQSNLRRGGGASGGGGGMTGGDGANEHNARFCRLRFACKSRGVCHGLAGYFETVLYEGNGSNEWERVELSTNPVTMDRKSKDMISWFPIFFPLKVPLYIPDDSELQVSMWRQTDDRKVWYEWIVESFVNVGGKKMRLGMSDLHSSKKSGCLM
ncbi:arginine N-methyltransferas-like protein [Rhizodiscina lignyota]|uniref:Protein arginine N-methyltransferase n=1 Tax=Rhizodiscina lignyota TaxID=1504668 RepID=A0A9P4I6H2_9PEZI|nr:arginine N-methyltransferas-like protein [Rhizodiscina lignyota]